MSDTCSACRAPIDSLDEECTDHELGQHVECCLGCRFENEAMEETYRDLERFR